MHVPSTIRTMHGSAMLPRGPMIDVRLTPAELHDLARLVDQRATEAQADGQQDTADRLTDRAAVLRSAGR